jgi:4-aminobutyrate aminotransferase-like enzyme
VALAVLEVIEKERLVANARASGEHLREGLLRLASRYPWVRDVRGAGLFVGVELAAPATHGPASPATKLTARQEAARVVNDLKRRGVLVGTTAREANVLKIRPPLTITRTEVDLILDALDQSLAAG